MDEFDASEFEGDGDESIIPGFLPLIYKVRMTRLCGFRD